MAEAKEYAELRRSFAEYLTEHQKRRGAARLTVPILVDPGLRSFCGKRCPFAINGGSRCRLFHTKLVVGGETAVRCDDCIAQETT